jgi:hypothetical protein
MGDSVVEGACAPRLVASGQACDSLERAVAGHAPVGKRGHVVCDESPTPSAPPRPRQHESPFKRSSGSLRFQPLRVCFAWTTAVGEGECTSTSSDRVLGWADDRTRVNIDRQPPLAPCHLKGMVERAACLPRK